MARRDRLSDKFSDIALNEPLTVQIEGKELDLRVQAKDVSTFMMIGQQEGEIGRKHLDALEDTLRTILERSYLPYYNAAADEVMEEITEDQKREVEEERDFIEGLLTRYYLQLFTNITEELGWHDGDIDASGLKENKKKEIEPTAT